MSMSPWLLGWLARGILLSAGLFAAAYGRQTLLGAEGWPRRQALQTEVQRVAQDIAHLTQQVRQIERQIVAERDRTEVQEALVRDRLGYVRPGDVVLPGPN